MSNRSSEWLNKRFVCHHRRKSDLTGTRKPKINAFIRPNEAKDLIQSEELARNTLWAQKLDLCFCLFLFDSSCLLFAGSVNFKRIQKCIIHQSKCCSVVHSVRSTCLWTQNRRTDDCFMLPEATQFKRFSTRTALTRTPRAQAGAQFCSVNVSKYLLASTSSFGKHKSYNLWQLNAIICKCAENFLELSRSRNGICVKTKTSLLSRITVYGIYLLCCLFLSCRYENNTVSDELRSISMSCHLFASKN